jgi:release factor glutamine methyltransferase
VSSREALEWARRQLQEAGIETPGVDAEWLLAHVLGRPRSALHLEPRELDPREQTRLADLVARRRAREPLAYVLGEWGFRRLTLRTDARALVPRPETEVVVERCLRLLDGTRAPDVLDVGTGSGAIALAIAQERRDARVTAIDVSPDALALARENAQRTAVDVRFDLADLTAGFGVEAYDLVVSNPPYVSEEEIETLQPEVRDWEPRLATVGETHTRDVAHHARDALRSGGHVVLEVAAARGAEIAALLGRLGYDEIVVTPDLTGRDRVADGRKP